MSTETVTDQTATGTATTNAGEGSTPAEQATTSATAGEANATTATANEGATTESKGDEQPAAVVYDFKAPEGMELDTTAVDEFKVIATELKLPADSAQKVVDLYAKLEAKRAEAFADQVHAWGEEVKADKEIGGDKLNSTLASARKVVDTFGSDAFKSLLNSTGMGNHPEVVRMLAKIGKAISEDGFVNGAPKPAAKSFYDNSNMN